MSRAKDIMTINPVTLPCTATAAEAVQVLQSLDVRHVPVLEGDSEVIGMLSDRDLRALSIPRVIDDEWLGSIRTALDTKIVAIMSSDVIAVDEETQMTEIIELMLEHKVGAVPVTDAEGSLVGIVSYVDVLRASYALESDAAE